MSGAIKYFSLALLIAATGVSARDMVNGIRLEEVRKVVASPSRVGRDRLLAGRERESPAWKTLAGTPPSEALALAALWIDQAAASPLAPRQTALAHADALLHLARMVRPNAADASLLQARADLVRYGAPRRSSLVAFAQSYDQAGFLREEGLWRLAFTAAYWPSLSDQTHSAAIDEAVWLAQLDARSRAAVDHLVTGTPLALPVELRLVR